MSTYEIPDSLVTTATDSMIVLVVPTLSRGTKKHITGPFSRQPTTSPAKNGLTKKHPRFSVKGASCVTGNIYQVPLMCIVVAAPGAYICC